jgi:aminoglycoside 6'-N-acetyltransferase I
VTPIPHPVLPQIRGGFTSTTIRAFVLDDVADYCALFQRVFGLPPWNEQWTVEAVRRDLERAMRRRGYCALVAEQGSAKVGYISGHRPPGFAFLPVLYIDQLFVDDRVQGAGIGTLLLSALASKAADGGCSVLALLTRNNSTAASFYRRHGFRRVLWPVRIRGKVLLCRRCKERRDGLA